MARNCISWVRFNTQPPEGGCNMMIRRAAVRDVSTHSRLKAAASDFARLDVTFRVSTHSRLKAAAS